MAGWLADLLAAWLDGYMSIATDDHDLATHDIHCSSVSDITLLLRQPYACYQTVLCTLLEPASLNATIIQYKKPSGLVGLTKLWATLPRLTVNGPYVELPATVCFSVKLISSIPDSSID